MHVFRGDLRSNTVIGPAFAKWARTRSTRIGGAEAPAVTAIVLASVSQASSMSEGPSGNLPGAGRASAQRRLGDLFCGHLSGPVR